MSEPGYPESGRQDVPPPDALIATGLLRAADTSNDARALFQAIRGEAGKLLDLRILYGNPAFWALSGLDSVMAVGRGMAEIFPAIDTTDGLAARLFQAMASGRTVTDRMVRERPQSGPFAGQHRAFELELTVLDELLAAGFRDITADVEAGERHRATGEDLATSLARFEALFEQAPIPLVVVSIDRTTRLNRAAIDLFGRDQDEMTRLSFQPNAPWIPADQEELWADVRHRISLGEPVTGARLALIRPDGERREVEGSSIPIVTKDGTRAGVVTSLIDLTDRLSLEAQFRHAQKMEALGRLAGGIAHDFNNVLMAIIGYAEFVARDARAGRPVTPDHAEQVVTATRRAIELTARLTAFARREPARQEPLDVADLIRAVMPLINRVAPESIEILTRLEPGPAVMLDRSEFEQVVLNLVVNAVDAMPSGGRLSIEVETVDLDDDHVSGHLGEIAGRHVLLAVSDSGVGMDDVTRARIFEPFYTTKGAGEGTGLGLSMVFAAVERAGGRIWVYSELGHGTTFKIYLPPAQVATTGVADGARSIPDPSGGSESILVLEDEDVVRELVSKALRRHGYDVTVAARPSEAFALASGRRFDLLLSDVVMPEMMGNAAAARLRETQPDLPVIFMSGYTAGALSFQLGPRDMLAHKPLTPIDLARVVRDALDRARSMNAS